MDFYQILLEIMEEKSFSIPDVARATGLSDSTIRSIISRKTKKVSLDVAFKMHKGLGVSLERLNGEEIKIISKDNNLSQGETTLLENYNKLNDLGKGKLTEYSNDLIETPKYKKEENDKVIELPKKKEIWEEEGKEHLMPIASHDDNLTDEEKNKMNAIINNYIKNKQ